jgi:hypothetical protein
LRGGKALTLQEVVFCRDLREKRAESRCFSFLTSEFNLSITTEEGQIVGQKEKMNMHLEEKKE